MAKSTYSNLISTYDTFANWLTKTNDVLNDMKNSVVTTNTSATADVTTGNGFVNGFFGANTLYASANLYGGTPTAISNLNISSNVFITSNTTVNALFTAINANVTSNLNAIIIVANNITSNQNLTVSNTATLNVATITTATVSTANITSFANIVTANITSLNVNTAVANVANVTTANISTLGVTGLSTLVNVSIGTGTSNVLANTTVLTIQNPSATATINATSFSGTAANATLLNSQNGAFYTNATNITTGVLPWAQAPTNTINTTGAFTITGVHTMNANLFVNAATLSVGNSTVNVTANTTVLVVGNTTANATVSTTGLFVANTSSNVTINPINVTINAGTTNGQVSANATTVSIGNATVYSTVTATGISYNGTLVSNSTNYSGTANNANNLGGVSLSTLQTQITSNSSNVTTYLTTNAYTISGVVTYNANLSINATNQLLVGNTTVNAVANQTTFFVANSAANTSINPGLITFNGGATINNTIYTGTANNSNALGGYIANTSSPSDGFVLAYNSSENRIKWVNPSGIQATLSTNNVVANVQLQAGSNGTTYVLNVSGNSTVTSTTVRANTVSLAVDSGSIQLNSNALVTNSLLAGNTTANVVITTGVVTIQNSTTSAQINATSFSRQANGATNLGPEGSGITLATIQSQITGNAATAYTNAITIASNASTLTTGTIPNARLAAEVVNTSGAFTITGVHTMNANLFVNAATLSVGNSTVNVTANTTTLAVGNTTANVTTNTTTIVIGTTTVNVSINSTSFSGTANNSSNFGGISLATLQGQITGNAATAYTNATTFASNASILTTGTLDAGRLPSTIVNTSASFTLAGGMTFDGTVRFNANVGFNRAPGTDNSRFNVLFPTTVNATDVLYIQKTRDSANAARYGFTDVGGLTSDSNGGAFWRGFHFAAPGITDGAAVSQFPRFAIAAETETLTNPSTRRWLLEAGNDSATSRYSIVMRTASADRFIIDGGGNAALGWTTTSVGAFSVSGPSLGSTAGDLSIISRLRNGTGNASGIDILSVRNSAGSDWTTSGQRLQAFTDSTFQSYIQFNGNNNNHGLSFGTGSNTTDRNTISERMRIVSNGHVGINTTSPFSILHALKTSGSGGSVAATGTTDGTTIARFGAGIVGMDMGVVDSGPAYIQARNVGDFATKYSLFLNPTGGNVGIGVNDPTTNLDVNGAIRSRDTFAFVARRSTSWAWSTILGGGSTTTSGYYAVYNPSDVRIGYMGYWDGSASNFAAAVTDSTTSLTLGTNGTTRLTIDGSTGQATFANKVLINGVFEWNGSASGIFEIKQENVSGSTAAAARTLQVFQNTNGQDAFMTFHTNSDFAFHFGLDSTTNDLFVGGWSFGAVKYRVWHEGNDSTLAAKTQTLTNKRINPRVSTSSNPASITPDVSTTDQVNVTGLAQTLTIAAPIGTPVNGTKLMIRVRDNGTGRSLSWNATYRAVGITLPTTTTASKTTYVGFIYNSDETTWDAIAVSTQA